MDKSLVGGKFMLNPASLNNQCQVMERMGDLHDFDSGRILFSSSIPGVWKLDPYQTRVGLQYCERIMGSLRCRHNSHAIARTLIPYLWKFTSPEIPIQSIFYNAIQLALTVSISLEYEERDAQADH